MPRKQAVTDRARIEHIAQHAQGDDVVCVFSNGGFGGIHGKLIERLKFRK